MSGSLRVRSGIVASLGASALFVACGGSDAQPGDFGVDGAAPPGSLPPGDPDASVGADGASGEDAGDLPGSGSRLRRVLLGPVGAPPLQFQRFHDNQTGLDCSPADIAPVSGTGPHVPEYRCMPPFTRGTSYFADAACTQSVFVGLARFGEVDSRCAAFQLQGSTLAPLTPIDAPPALYRVSGSCTADPQYAPGDVWPVFQIGTAIPVAQLAALTELRDLVAPNLEATGFASEDGARSRTGYSIPSAGLSCQAWPDRDGTLRCLPGPLSARIGFSDPACATPLVSIPSEVQAPIVRLATAGACPQNAGVLSVSQAGDRPLYELSTEGQCTGGFGRQARGATVVAELDPTTFVAFAQETVAAGPRLSAVLHVLEGQRELAYYTDALRDNRPCRFYPTSDGAVRCLPYEPTLPPASLEASTTLLYTDAACTLPIRVATPRSRFTCAGTDVLVAMDSEGCPETEAWKVYPLGPEVSQTSYYEAKWGGCYSRSNYSSKVHVLGPELPSGDFAEGVRTIE